MCRQEGDERPSVEGREQRIVVDRAMDEEELRIEGDQRSGERWHDAVRAKQSAGE